MADPEALGFEHMGLDPRLLQAVADLGWSRPTLIQEKAIPLALEGKDLLARARTGSGKTAAYAVPMLQLLLHRKATGPAVEQAVRGLVLVPTKELARQARTMIQQLAAYCARDIRVADVSAAEDSASQRAVLMEKPDIIVGTPSRILNHLQQDNLILRDSLELLVVDEADLLFSFGFEEELKSLLCHLPRIYQAFLMSATFNEDVQALKELVLHNPVTLKLQESQLPGPDQLKQFQVVCETEEDKFLLLYALLKLSLIRGKSLLFVNTLERGYRLRLFLEQFGIPACVLNGELPLQSRCHIISQFNQGFYDCVIATDTEVLGAPVKGKRRGKGPKRDRTARANNPGMVLTFMLPAEQSHLDTIEELLSGENGTPVLLPYQFRMEEIEGFRYRCRVSGMQGGGEQVRVRSSGTRVRPLLHTGHEGGLGCPAALTFGVHPPGRHALGDQTGHPGGEVEGDQGGTSAFGEAQGEAQGGGARPPWETHVALSGEHMGTAAHRRGLGGKTDPAIHPSPPQTYFEDNPRDLQLLRHDLPLHPAVVKPHLGHVPDYLGKCVALGQQRQGSLPCGVGGQVGRGTVPQARWFHPSS
uniref:RNA helicase n=1 Tax=Suricata suricatta TaxID=37032 RepID=A0A673T4F0_SURSU